MAGLLNGDAPSGELAILALLAAARELPLPVCRELGRRINEFVLFESQVEQHLLASEATSRRLRFIGALRVVAEVLGGVPASTDYLAEYERRRDLGEERLPSLSAIVKFFGGWEPALAAASLVPEPPPSKVERIRQRKGRKINRYPVERIVEALQACARDIGKPPTVREYSEWREEKLAGRPGRRAPGADIPHYRTIQDCLGSWVLALELAGFSNAADTRAQQRPFTEL